ncbi:MAG TPA: hypothetical protein VM940_09115 [Chthoniobacterales bacterium]|jgi:hypothetical protein|nr:hypothetical protein [Chthoniobacterales bacterium]
MRFTVVLTSICAGLFFAGCADTSLTTDEEYDAARVPAPAAEDPMRHVPPSTDNPVNRY